ncbi:hypothetical protein FNF29_06795 [Cafeteria roenbergensis]|uniref:Uncharacterized protein n=1 Tax=Cafeteria roenbergensis TaxID=33653 RepID=A0A5A8C6X0_CAFRO|nr:hypothetical protein FNF29_06795 [Cafeteria roenbergensis]|eukprot:KAA0148259.1 hypothetical protein FNF29_06795 [Cafeteria roenbergensis]
MARSTLMSVLLVVLGILLPPLAVFVDEPKINDEFFISILLTICGWLPGIIHAFWVIFFGGKGQLKMMDVLILVCCILLPPLGVFLKQQKITIDFLVALILCFLFWFPAIIFAIEKKRTR